PRCGDCPPGSISWARSALLYEGPVRDALMAMKFGGLRSVASAFAPYMATALGRVPPGRRATGPIESAVITWVPLSRRRRRDRGFDQAETLARALGEVVSRPVKPLLRRLVETAPQARRARAGRRTALRGAFEAWPESSPPVVILV